MALLEIRNLSKHYGAVKAVDGLDLNVEQGSVFGFMGLNGAGKTTTLRMITGLARPTGGEMAVCGDRVNFGSSSANRHIGYLPDVPEFYGFMRPVEYLTLCGRLYGMDGAHITAKCKELLPLVGLDGVKRRIGGFSRGMKQRLGIAQALIHDPQLLLLDEPTSALDPVGRKEILGIIGALRGRLTVLFSTHILSDVERVCDTIGIIHHGRLVLKGSLDEVREKFAGESIRIEAGRPEKLPELKERLEKLAFIREVRVEDQSRLLLVCSDISQLSAAICPLLSGMGLPLYHFERVESKLEDVFIEAIKLE